MTEDMGRGAVVVRSVAAAVGLIIVVDAVVIAVTVWGDTDRTLRVGYGLVIGFVGLLVLLLAVPPRHRKRTVTALALVYVVALILGVAWAMAAGPDGGGADPGALRAASAAHGDAAR